jgi:ADP-ribose pyrophosphatase YjhB (NUDIX family)
MEPPATKTTSAALRRRLHRGLLALWRALPDRLRPLALRLGTTRVSVGVCALVQDARGRLLLTHHTYREQPWGLPGGFIGRREQPGAALARELREELGVAAHIGPLVYAETWLPGQHMTLYYTATLRGIPAPDGVEVDGFHFATLDEAGALLGCGADPWLAALRERRAS